ncbi:MAG: penicillin-binding transpeptidase domain-containing protein, partial [Eubacteriales bacterium]|nr:penicillin-binding transpeptidase domain-containing protein [Eubacteriales bacterium]
LIPAKSVKNVDLARIGFGQSVAVTPIQLLTAACAVVNGGRLMKPFLLKEALSPTGELLYRAQPKVVATPVSAETSAVMRTLLERVVEEGGGKNAKVPGYRIGGKTGTAQVYKDGKIVRNVHIGSFLGFAPADDPRFALLVIVDEADRPVDYGGTTAAPFAGQILADVLPYLGCKPESGAQPRTELTVPDLLGKPLWQARQELNAMDFKALDDGRGDTVTAQMPAGGAKLIVGGQVMLYTDEEEPADVDTLICVPDVQGLSIAQAGRLLRQRGLEMMIEGGGLAAAQSPAAGEYLPPDGQVTVTFSLPD